MYSWVHINFTTLYRRYPFHIHVRLINPLLFPFTSDPTGKSRFPPTRDFSDPHSMYSIIRQANGQNINLMLTLYKWLNIDEHGKYKCMCFNRYFYEFVFVYIEYDIYWVFILMCRLQEELKQRRRLKHELFLVQKVRSGVFIYSMTRSL